MSGWLDRLFHRTPVDAVDPDQQWRDRVFIDSRSDEGWAALVAEYGLSVLEPLDDYSHDQMHKWGVAHEHKEPGS